MSDHIIRQGRGGRDSLKVNHLNRNEVNVETEWADIIADWVGRTVYFIDFL